MKIKISKEISLPIDVVTQTIAILAKRRAGKSYTMRKLVEQLLSNDQQVILVDPKGDQWGIRSSADGKNPGYPIVILGGEHGDAPLEVNAGEVVAKLVVEERVSVLLDLSIFRKHETASFMTAFLENLYRLKAQEKFRTPVMLVIDEADAIAPQKPQKGEERMLGAAEDIVRRGGQRGIGCALITQRSAVLNKNVLTQAQMLIVLRTIAPQDLSAMKSWIEVHGTLEEGKTLMDSLPSLPIGDAWFWSPGWPTDQGIFQRSHILPIETFDSGATPKPGQKKIVPKNLADVDLEALKKQMSATIEKAKKENPTELKKRISALEHELLGLRKESVSVAMGVSQWLEYGKKNGYSTFFLEKAVNEALISNDRKWQDYTKEINKQLRSIAATMAKMKIMIPDDIPIFEVEANKTTPIVKVDPNIMKDLKYHIGVDHAIPGGDRTVKTIIDDGKYIEDGDRPLSLTKCARTVLSYLHSVYPKQKTKAQLWIATGYAQGGGFNNCISELTTNGLITNYSGKYSSSEIHDPFLVDESFDSSYEKWFPKLTLCARKVFQLLLEDTDAIISKSDLAERTGYAQGGGFNNCISELKRAELIKKVGGGYQINEIILDL